MSTPRAVMPPHWPVAGFSGYSGSGKTTLIEQLIPALMRDGLAVAVVKHDAHRLDVDRPGKDSDRFFRAGATVFAHDNEQGFLRSRPQGGNPLLGAVERLLENHDIVLVEGHKQTPLPVRFWLSGREGEVPPQDSGVFQACLEPGPGRFQIAHRLVSSWLRETLVKTPLRAGILLGGRSTRMGQPKHLLKKGSRTWVEAQVDALSAVFGSVCLLGAGAIPDSLAELPQLPDPPGRAGPLAGMLAAMRWDPESDWFFVPCDMPSITPEAIQWLLSHRLPGDWAVMTRREEVGQVEPLFAWMSHRMRGRLAHTDRPIALSDHPKTRCVVFPEEHRAALNNINTPGDLSALG